jgi:ferredoxin/flavodoxin---NADP+ reductase
LAYGPIPRMPGPMTQQQPRQAVAVVGGAVAGARLAEILAEAGLEVAVFEQNRRPYGKIEDGLPRWHTALRQQEYRKIRERLSKGGVHFVPLTRIGQDVTLDGLIDDWGFTAVVLACGAWRDRPLPVDGIDTYLGKGFVYQNPFIIAFNHAEDPEYVGPNFEVEDEGIVVGGGLASIDVVKVMMLETTRKKLRELGHDVDVETLEKAGLEKACATVGVQWSDLGLKGATLFYRRQAEDMPLQEIPEGADDKKREKVRSNRRKMLERTMQKYKFHFEPLSIPDAPLIENDRVVGLRFRRAELVNGRVTPTDETFERRGSLVVSSIGSIPNPIQGVPMRGELFAFEDWELGRISGLPRVFSCGNVVTGKGNIVASGRHAASVGERLISAFLGLEERTEQTESQVGEALEQAAAPSGPAVAEAVTGQLPELEPGQLEAIRKRIRERQAQVGFEDLDRWMDRHAAQV